MVIVVAPKELVFFEVRVERQLQSLYDRNQGPQLLKRSGRVPHRLVTDRLGS